jgi:hypothetical protein
LSEKYPIQEKGRTSSCPTSAFLVNLNGTQRKSLLESRLERSRWRDGPPACYCHFNPFAGKRCGERLSDFACT